MDAAREKANKELEKLEDRIRREYESAKDDITKQWRGYMERADKRIASAQRKYDVVSADKTASPDDIKKARKDLEDIKTSVTLRDERYKAVVDGFTDRLANVNSIAINYANDSIPSLYTIGYNQAGNDMQTIGMSFTLYNEDVVKNLIKQGDVKFPTKKLNIPKDKRWNTKQINSSVLQGILQGESMDKIANRIYPIVDRNSSSAIRSARTLVTGAENKGRLDSYKRMEQSGIVLNKVWLSTPDGRTRDWHVDMDGQTVPVNEMFIDGLGNELEYPGDPGGAPESVYNCRCTMYTDIIGFRRADGSVVYVDYFGNDIDKNDPQHIAQMQEELDRRHRSKGYYKPVKNVNGLENTERNDIEKLFRELNAKYKARVTNVIDKLTHEQNEYDLYYKNYVTKLMNDNPKMRRSTAEKRAVEVLGERPQKVDILLCGDYNSGTGVMTINTTGLHTTSNIQEDIGKRMAHRERQEQRAREGLRVRPLGNVGDSTQSTFIHEYGHAIDYTYGVAEDERFLSFYRSLSEDEIKLGVSSYATESEREFIAEAFCESYMGNTQSDLSKRFMSILEEIVNDKR